MKNMSKLTQREKDVMAIIWHMGKPLTASSIAENGDGLSINTIQVAVRSLMKKEYIEVADIVYSGTVLTRSYKHIISAEEFAAAQLQSMRTNTLNFSTLSFVEHLLENNQEDILDELEKIIKSKKEQVGD